MVVLPIIIWQDWKDELFAFCSKECQQHYTAWEADPGYLFERATWSDAIYGCMWCGCDLAKDVEWLSSQPE